MLVAPMGQAGRAPLCSSQLLGGRPVGDLLGAPVLARALQVGGR